jgi:hypothetical protein
MIVHPEGLSVCTCTLSRLLFDPGRRFTDCACSLFFYTIHPAFEKLGLGGMHLLMHRRIRLLRFSPLLAHHEKLAGHCLPCVLSCAHYVRYESKYGLLVFLLQGPSRKIGQRGGPVGGVSQGRTAKERSKGFENPGLSCLFFFFFLSLPDRFVQCCMIRFSCNKERYEFPY